MKHLLSIFILVVQFMFCCGQHSSAIIFTPLSLLHDTIVYKLHNFSVTQKDNKALLQWKSDSLPDAENFYTIERSDDGIHFNLVGVTKASGSGWAEFLDDSPPKGKIFYRVKLSSGQTSWYSEIIPTIFEADASCKFYPNPVDKVLIIKSERTTELLISDRFGKALITDKFPGGLKVIDVSSLEPGIYVITLFQKESGRQITEKLVKK